MSNIFITDEGFDGAALAQATGYGQVLVMAAMDRLIARTSYEHMAALDEVDLVLALVVEQEAIRFEWNGGVILGPLWDAFGNDPS